MASALIGYTGFVGSNLLSQLPFDDCYNSKNIDTINGKHYELVVCAGVPAAKWIANRDPIKDRENIDRLSQQLASMKADKFILISTVDVYPVPVDVDEGSPIDTKACEPYGKHRLQLEHYVANQFDTFIVRLPGLFGPGLKKNVIYDFLHNNNVNQINPNGVFQFYSLEHLAHDINVGRQNGLKLLNITSEPTSVAEVARICLGHEFANDINKPAARYDYRSRYAHLFGGHDGYLYSKEQVLSDLKKFVDHERKQTS
jgi:nucleoside-diphosphate-sugar epimerase